MGYQKKKSNLSKPHAKVGKMKNQLYICTTKTAHEKGLIKVGQSKDPTVRIKSGQTFSHEKIEIIKTIDLPNNIKDHDVHEKLKESVKPLKIGGAREWFKATIEDVERVLNELTGKGSRAHSFKLRSEQGDAVEKAVKWFQRNSFKNEQNPRFLLNAKMRFGKCFTTLHIAKKLKCKKVLVITYKPEVLSEWTEIADDHLDFSEWSGILAKSNKHKRTLSLNQDGSFPNERHENILMCVSLQDLCFDKEKNTKVRLQRLVKEKWDLIVFDEVHFGGITPRARDIIQELAHERCKRIDLSGTPFRLMQHEDFDEKQVYSYSYLDEQKKKKEEIKSKKKTNTYRIFPDLNFSTLDITKEDLQEDLLNFKDENLIFSLNKLLKAHRNKETKKYQFDHPVAVNSFINGLQKNSSKATSISVYGSLSHSLGLPQEKRHSIWWVDSVNTAKAMVTTLKEHHYFRKFEIVDASGSGKKELLDDMPDITLARDKKHVESAIKQSQADQNSLGTITITVKRFLVGVTIKEWDSILILNDVEAPEEYYQAIFRIQSPWEDKLTKEIRKNTGWVFDFSLNRCLTLKINLAATIAAERQRKKGLNLASTKDHLKSTIQELVDAVSLKSYVDGKLTPNSVNADDVLQVMSLGVARASLARKITSDLLVRKIPKEILEKNSKLLEILARIKGYRTQEVSSNHAKKLAQIGPVEGDLRGKNKDKKKKKTGSKSQLTAEEKELKRKIRLAITQIKRLSICLSDFIYMTKKRENCLDDVVSNPDAKFFRDVTGITKDEFNYLCDLELIRRDKLEENILDFYFQEVASLISEEFVSKEIKKLNKIAA